MKELIDMIIRTLDTIPVSGKDNLDRMLGCIMTLQKLSDALKGDEQPDENDHPE